MNDAGKTKWKKLHMHIDIKQTLTYPDKKLKQMFKGEPRDIRDFLVAELRKGFDYLPFGECGNRGPDGMCAGHEVEEKETEVKP
jgi:hypothetical protein